VPHEAQQQLVGEAGLAGAARAGDPHHGGLARHAGHGAAQGFAERRVAFAPLERGDGARDLLVVARADRAEAEGRARRPAYPGEDVVDHPVEAQPATVLRRVDALDAVGFEFLDLVRRDRAAAADDDADVRGIEAAQHVDHVLEVLDVPALVGTAGDTVGVFLDRGAHDVGNAAVVPEVHDLRAVRLQQSADDVDRRVVAVEQRGGADEAQRCGGGRVGLVGSALTACVRCCWHRDLLPPPRWPAI
jgi:hypothetical protein